MKRKHKQTVTNLTCDSCGEHRSPLKKVGAEWFCFDCVELAKKEVPVAE